LLVLIAGVYCWFLATIKKRPFGRFFLQIKKPALEPFFMPACRVARAN